MLPLSWGCFGSLVWKTCYIPKLWGIVEAFLLLFHLASLSSTMDNTTYSLFQHGSLCAENIPPERWLMPQITFCCVHSTHRKWWEFRLTHPQVPSLYISSFLFFFFFPFPGHLLIQKLSHFKVRNNHGSPMGYRAKMVWASPTLQEGNRTRLVSLSLMGGQQHKEKKDECFIDPVVFAVRALASTLPWKSAGEDTPAGLVLWNSSSHSRPHPSPLEIL